MSCHSASFCAAVGYYGFALTYDGTSWSADGQVDGSGEGELTSVSCPSDSFCAAVDGGGNALAYEAGAWSASGVVDPNGALGSVSCPSPSFCAAVDGSGHALTFSNPPGAAPEGEGPRAPIRRGRPHVNPRTGVITVTYEFFEPGSALEEGQVRAGASLARVPAALRNDRALGYRAARARHGKCRKGQVRKHGRCVSNKPVRYGRSRRTIKAAGLYKLRIKPRRRVLAALKRGKTLHVALTLSFRPTGTTVTLRGHTAARVHLKRRRPHRRHH